MTKIINKLNLNRSPQLVENNSLIFAKNIKLDETTGNIVNDDDLRVSNIIEYIRSLEDYKNHKIVGGITTPNELLLFVYFETRNENGIRIIRYNEYYDKINDKIIKENFKLNISYIWDIAENKVFEKDEDVVIWECANCGHVHIGKNAPEKCPVCDHPQSYFFVKANNF